MNEIIRMLRQQIADAKEEYNRELEHLEEYQKIVKDIEFKLTNIVKRIESYEEAIRRMQNVGVY